MVKKPRPLAKAQLTRLARSGQGLAPKKGASDDDVKELVRKTPGAIGFVRTSAVDGTVTELHKVP